MGTIVFRVEGNPQVGAGHLMRCLALAEQLRALEREAVFVGRDHEKGLHDLVEKAGFSWIPLRGLELEPGKPISNGQEADDAAATLRAIEGLGEPVDWLIVDHYEIDIRWEQVLRPAVEKIFVIDDLADRQHDCDILLDQNFVDDAETRYAGLVPASTRLLLGPKYALLRSQFRQPCPRRRDGASRVNKIVIAFGGADLPNATRRVLEAMSRLEPAGIHIDVIIGAANPHGEALTEAGSRLSVGRIRFHVDVENMAQLLEDADLAIGAGGCSNWERFCLGVPSLILSLADNQVPGALALGTAGHCLYLGRLEEVTDDKIGAAITTLLTSATLRSSLARSSASLVDGAGAMRVAAELLAPSIVLRRATAADARFAFEWRNAEENRRYARDTRPIPLEEHLAWFEKTLTQGDRVLLIAESEGVPIGVLRYDLQGNAAEVSVYLSPTHHGRGAGRRILREGSSWIKAHYPGVNRLLAEIKPENARSARAFAAAGYHHSIDRYEAALC